MEHTPRAHRRTPCLSFDAAADHRPPTSYVFTSSRAPCASDSVVTLPFHHQPKLSYGLLQRHGLGASHYTRALSDPAAAAGQHLPLPSDFIPLRSPSIPFEYSCANNSWPPTPFPGDSFFDSVPCTRRRPEVPPPVRAGDANRHIRHSPMPALVHRPKSYPLAPIPSSAIASWSSSVANDDSEKPARPNHPAGLSPAKPPVPINVPPSQKAAGFASPRLHLSKHRLDPPSGPETQRNLSLAELYDIFRLGSPAKTGFQANDFVPGPLQVPAECVRARSTSLPVDPGGKDPRGRSPISRARERAAVG